MGEVSTCLPEIEALPAKTQAIGFGLTGLSYRSCAIVTSYFLVGDSISWLQVAGLGLTLVGAWLVNRKPEPVAA